MNVTLYQMAVFNKWMAAQAAKKAQAERQAAVMAAMKKPVKPEQVRMFA